MANNFAPFGFRPVNTSNGPINWRISTRRVKSTDTNPLYKGDVTMAVTSPGVNGYITRAIASDFTAPGAVCTGIFWGCQYLSISQQRVVWSQSWTGAGDSNGDVLVYTIDDPNARFVVQSNALSFNITGTNTDFGYSPIGQYCNFNVGVPSPITQQSGAFVDTLSTTQSFPFIVTNLVLDPPGSNGTDANALGNWVEVGFNNEWLRTNSAVTGI